MFKKTMVMLLALSLLLPVVRPALIKNASANPVKIIYKVTDEVADAMMESMKARKGVKFDLPNGSKSTRDEFVEAFKRGLDEALEESVETINGNALNATPVANKPGWLKATVGTGLFVTGLDVWLDVYQELQDFGTVTYTTPEHLPSVYGPTDFIRSFGGVRATTVYNGQGNWGTITVTYPDGFVFETTKRMQDPRHTMVFTVVSTCYSQSNNYGGWAAVFRYYDGSTDVRHCLQAGKGIEEFLMEENVVIQRLADKTQMRYENETEINWDPELPTQEVFFPDPEAYPDYDEWLQELEDNYDWLINPDTYNQPEPTPTPTPTPSPTPTTEPTEEPVPTYTPLPSPSLPPAPTLPPNPDPGTETDGLSGNDRTFLEWLTNPITQGVAALTGLIGIIGHNLSQGVSSIGATLTRIDTKTSKCQCIELPSVYKPWALLLPFLQFLSAMVGFLVKIGAFVATIPAVPSVPINNAAFQWFRSATILGVQVYNVVSTLAAAGLALSVYRIIRSRF